MKKFICISLILSLLLSFTTVFAASDPADTFDVLQIAGTRPQWCVGGLAMLAKFDGAPGKIYVAREVTKLPDFDRDASTPFLSSCIAKVIDPNGNLVAEHDFSHMGSIGKEYHVFDIKKNIPGIWKIQLMNGRHADIFSIGINGTDIWGIRGEKTIGKSKTLPAETWLYTHENVDYLYTGVSEDSPITLYDDKGKVVATSVPGTRSYVKQKIDTTDIQPNKAYRVDYGKGYYGEIEIDGIPGLICPTKEAAETLKGGWIKLGSELGGVTVQGPLQKRAREEILRLINTKNLKFTYEKPEALPSTLKNPMAEAQLFGQYGIVSGIGAAVDNQILDPQNPYLGITDGEPIEVPELNWQHGHFKEMNGFAGVANSMANMTVLDLELNHLKGNDALIQRAAIALLGMATQLSEDDSFRNKNMRNSYVVMTKAMFTMDPYVQAYQAIRDKLDTQTRELLDQIVIATVDKMGNYMGQGPTNQALFSMSYTIRAYDIFRMERYHETFKRQIASIIDYTNHQHGITELGYFMESGGCDSGYEYMNKYHYGSIYEFYKNMEGADPELVERIKSGIQKNLEFESFFWAPQPQESNVTMINALSFTSRTNTLGVGTDNYPGYSMVWDEFPLARRRFEMDSGRKNESAGYLGYPHRINSEVQAWKQIKKYWPAYDKQYTDGYGLSNWPLTTFNAFNATECVEPAENLPYEAEDGTIWDKDGFVAFKHKGLYGTIFYAIDDSTWNETVSLMGGGPTFLWAEGAGKTLVSKKNVGYYENGRVEAVNDVIASCIYSTDAEGNLKLYSGKEGTSHYGGLSSISKEWLVPNKKFRISGEIPDANAKKDTGSKVMSGKTVSWTYDLTDTGINLTVDLEGMDNSEAYWVNLPIPGVSADANIKTEFENGKLVFKNGTGGVTYEWDKNLTSYFADEVKNTNCLRIRIPETSGSVTVKITAQVPDFTISEMGLYHDSSMGDKRPIQNLRRAGGIQYISYRMRNNTGKETKAKLVIAYYNDNGKLMSILAEKPMTIAATGTTRYFSDGLSMVGKRGEIRAFVWVDDGKVYPVMAKNIWSIN